MRRRHLLIGTGSMLAGAGCLGRTDQSADSPTESPTESASPSDTQTTECKRYDLGVWNSTTQKVVAHLTIRHNTRWKGGSPTPTTAKNASPTETPVETFSDTATLAADESTEYENVTVDYGSVLEITVEDGPEEKFSVHPDDMIRTKSAGATITEETITFGIAHVDC